MEAKRTQNRRVLRGALVVVVVAGMLWIALPGGRDLLLGIAMWSLVAIPLVAAGIYFARHDWDVGRFFGGVGIPTTGTVRTELGPPRPGAPLVRQWPGRNARTLLETVRRG